MPVRKKRILSYDLLRILAISMVVMIHCTLPFLRETLPPSADFTWANALNSLSRAAVPLFLMLSGALMLDETKQMDFRSCLRRTGTLLALLVVWSLIFSAAFYLILPLLRHQPVSLRYAAKQALLGYYHLRFLNLIIGLYLITPILRLFVKKENARYVLYFMLLSAVFRGSVPLLNFALNRITGSQDLFRILSEKFNMGFVEPYLTCYLLGWFLTNCTLTGLQRKVLCLLGFAGLLLSFFGTQLFTSPECKAFDIFYANESIHVILYSAAIFAAVHHRFGTASVSAPVPAKLIRTGAVLSFGVYLIHEAIRPFVEKLLMPRLAGWKIPLLWLAVLAASYAAAYVLSRIPGLRKLVKC